MKTQLSYKDCLKGAKVAINQCLGLTETEKVTIVETPLSTAYKSLTRANRILWWYRSCGRESEKLEAMVGMLVKQRDNIELALKAACEEIGCPVQFYGIDTSRMLDANLRWVSTDVAHKVLRDLLQTDVLIDMTLFGLDELPPARKFRRYHNLRRELVATSKIRGADLHIVSDRSFATGAMCADYDKIAADVCRVEELVKNSRHLDIITEDGTDLRVEIDPGRVFKGTGMIRKTGEYHFLPSGIVGVCLKKGGSSGRLFLNGPSYAVGSFEQFPITLEIDSRGKIAIIDLSKDAPYYELINSMLRIEEGRYLGELVIGLNSCGSVRSMEPMEFYVARGAISLAIGRNDHIGGEIVGTTPASLHVHVSIPRATVELDDRQTIIKNGNVTALES